MNPAPIGPWTGIAIIMIAMSMLMLALQLYQRRRKTEPETVRKLFHLLGGFIALALPWLFDSAWPVLLMTLLSVGGLAAIRFVPALLKGPGQVLHAVERHSYGEFFFIIGVCLIFLLADGDKVLFSVPIIILAIADSSAALVGVVYGKHLVEIHRGWKTAEGSIVFFFTALMCVHVPVLLGTDVGRLESLIIALNLAFIMMLTEAVAWRGSDNLLLPVLVFLLLDTFLDRTAAQLILQLVVVLGLSTFVYVVRRRATLSDDALIGSVLVGYVSWALGDWRYLVAPAFMLVTYTRLTRTTELSGQGARPFRLPVLLGVTAPGLFWVAAHAITDRPDFFYPYTAAYGAMLAIVCAMRQRLVSPAAPALDSMRFSVARGALIPVLPLLVVDGFTLSFMVHYVAAVLCIYVAALVFNVLEQSPEAYTEDPMRWSVPAIVATLTSALVLLTSLIGFGNGAL